MSSFDQRIDDYISNAQPFAQPILIELRTQVHHISDEIVETIKWGFPHFMYRKKILCSFASFKHHCSFGFWLESQISDPNGLFKRENKEGMGSLGKISSLTDLPSKAILKETLLEAIQLIDQGNTLKKKALLQKAELVLPQILLEELKTNQQAFIFFNSLSLSQQREYTDWIESAKSVATQHRRLKTTISNLMETKRLNWKYEK